METNIIKDHLDDEIDSKVGESEDAQSQDAILKNDSKSVGRIPEKRDTMSSFKK